MKAKNFTLIPLVSLAVTTLTWPFTTAIAQGTAFTYQGRLNSSGSPANGLYDFRFKLATDPLGNNEVGGDFLTNAIPVTSGLFTTTIDFGSGIFTGSSYWLEVDVRTNNPANTLAYTALAPLQAVTPLPYAIMAGSASNLLGALPANLLPGVVVTNNEANVALDNVTLGGNLNLPATTTFYAGGYSLLYADGSSGLLNLFFGVAAGNPNVSGYDNTAIGNETLDYITTGDYNTALGIGALLSDTVGSENTAIGSDALFANTDGSYNTALGSAALGANLTGIYNTANGYQALQLNTSGYENVANGFEALGNSTNDSELVAIGCQALENDNAYNNGFTSDGNGHNTAIGYQALQLNGAGSANTAIGYQALYQNTNGLANTASGDKSLYSNTSGAGNTADGEDALYENTSGAENVAEGYLALLNNTNGSENTAVGVLTLQSTTGNDNIALGFEAGASLSAGNNNIYIGNPGNSIESGIIRLGTPGTQTTALIAGNVGLGGVASPQQTLSLNGGMNLDQSSQNMGNINSNALTFGSSSGEGIGSLRTSGKSDSFGLNFYTDFDKRMTILQNGNVGIVSTNPADLLVVGGSASPAYCNGTTWVNGSDRNSKEHFSAINPLSVLAKVSALPITKWKYKVEADGTEHLGPMAQDFHAAFGLNGADDKHIATVDEEGVALAAIQGLNERLQEELTRQDTENAALKQQNDSLAQRLNELEVTVKQLAAKK